MTFEDPEMLRMKFGIYSDLTGVLVFHLKMFEVYPEGDYQGYSKMELKFLKQNCGVGFIGDLQTRLVDQVIVVIWVSNEGQK